MPAPRLSSSAVDRSNTSTSQPRSRRTSAAVSPPSEPPTTPTRGQPLTGPLDAARPFGSRTRPYGAYRPLGLAEDGDAVHTALEQHPPLVHGRVAEAVGRLSAGVLGPRLVNGLGGPVP